MKKPADAEIHPLLRERWSPRAFDPKRPVPAQAMARILQAAGWAPSCFGEEPWAFVVADRHASPNDFKAALGCLAPPNAAWAQNAAVLVAVFVEANFRHNGKPNALAEYDAGAAAMSLVLQAEAEGLRAHQMAGFNKGSAHAAFDSPEEFFCRAFVALGHQAAPDSLQDDGLKARELAPRQRRPLPEFVFAGKWGRQLVFAQGRRGIRSD